MAASRLRPSLTTDDDLRPLLVSWSIALAGAVAWLVTVHLAPTVLVAPVRVNPQPDSIVSIDADPGARRSPIAAARTAVPPGGRTMRRTVSGVMDIAGIFAADVTRRALNEVTRAIPGVQAVQADIGAAGAVEGKTALGSSRGDDTPGRTVLGSRGGTDAAGVGQVRHGATVDRSEFHAHALATVSAPAIDGQLVDATELGGFVRGRVAQLQSCYESAGGTDLAGVVALRITVAADGSVRSAEIVRRSWSGPAAAATESCLLRVARGWHLPSADAGATVTFPISFTRGA